MHLEDNRKSPEGHIREEGADAESPQPAVVNADDLAQALRLHIQKSELLPGEWIREARLCAEFGVGRSIARRALRTLADDGLVELEENRGARVSATSVEEVFDLYEIRAALYGLAARFACLRAQQASIQYMLLRIDEMLAAAESGDAADHIIEISEAIFSAMAESASPDAQKMIESIRRKTRWHFSYVALAINANGPGPYEFWRRIRAALVARDADKASQAARELIYFMQSEVSRIMLSHGRRRESVPFAQPAASTTRKPRKSANRR
jgi:DNA-binding GntR family transcriptional regulator